MRSVLILCFDIIIKKLSSSDNYKCNLKNISVPFAWICEDRSFKLVLSKKSKYKASIYNGKNTEHNDFFCRLIYFLHPNLPIEKTYSEITNLRFFIRWIFMRWIFMWNFYKVNSCSHIFIYLFIKRDIYGENIIKKYFSINLHLFIL